MTAFLLALVMIGYARLIPTDLFAPPPPPPPELARLNLNPAEETRTQPTGGAFATFYRGTNFHVPFRAEKINGPFSYRTDHELGAGFPQQNVSGRFSAWLVVPTEGKYKFYLDANDGVRIWLNGELIHEDWDAHAIGEMIGEFELPARRVPLFVEWYNNKDNGWLGLWWEGPGVGRQFLPAERLIPDPGVRPAP